jgi:hypothetical protein
LCFALALPVQNTTFPPHLHTSAYQVEMHSRSSLDKFLILTLNINGFMSGIALLENQYKEKAVIHSQIESGFALSILHRTVNNENLLTPIPLDSQGTLRHSSKRVGYR